MDVQTVSIVIAAVSVVIGVINSIMSNRKAEEQRQTEIETRQAELFMNVYNRWNTHDIQMAYGNWRFLLSPKFHDFSDYQREVLDERAKGNLAPWYYGQIMITYLEGLGMLVKQGLINIELVEDLFAGRIIWFWETFGPICEIRRQQIGDPNMYDSLEFLYNALKQREQVAVTT